MPGSPRREPKVDLWGVRTPIPAGKARLFSALSLVAVFATWCLLSYVQVTREGKSTPLVSHFFLPPPHEVVKSLLYLFFEQGLLDAIGTSTLRILKAFGLSVAVALPLGIAMGAFETLNRVFDPIVAPLRYLPVSAFIPLLILWFGIGESQKVAFLFLGTVVYLLPVVVDAIRAVPDELVQTAYTLGASKVQVVRTVLIPAALPAIFDSFRVMNAIAWTYIILAEMVNAKAGVGYILQLADRHTRPEWSFAGILVVGVIGLCTDVLIRLLNRLIFPWKEADA